MEGGDERAALVIVGRRLMAATVDAVAFALRKAISTSISA
jgi:hypothetical protein